MFKKYADEKHRKQAEEFIMEIGEFVLAFERVCDDMRHTIMLMLRAQGLQNQGMAQVVVDDKASADLQLLMGAIYCELPNQDAEDKKHVQGLLARIKKVTERRNILLHSAWNFGNQAAYAEMYAATIRLKPGQNKGGSSEIHGYSASYVRDQSRELTKIQVLLRRLQICIAQAGHKVSTKFSKLV